MNGVVSHKRFDFTNELHDQLAQFGLNRSEQTLAIPYMWFTPAGSDPDAPPAQAIVLAVQNALRYLGLPIKPTGYVDALTIDGLCQVAGRNWKSKPWTHIFRDLRGAMLSGIKLKPGRGPKAVGMFVPMLEGMGAVPLSSIRFTPKGTAVATNSATEGLFRELQRQLNRIAHVTDNMGKLKVDGMIGKNTVAAVVAAENAAGQSVVMTHTPEGVARSADSAVDAFRHAADQLGAPAKVAGSTSSKHAGGGDEAVRVDPTREGSLTVAPDASIQDFIGSPIGLVAIGVGAFGLFWFLDKGGKKKGKRRRRR